MNHMVQVKAEIPRDLKRRAFVAFALQGETYAGWLRKHLELWVKENQQAVNDLVRKEQVESVE